RAAHSVGGVGPARAEQLAHLGIRTVADLIAHYPRAYLDATQTVAVRDLVAGRLLTVVGQVMNARVVRTRRGRADFTASIADGTGRIECYWFGQGFLQSSVRPGMRLVVSGELESAASRRFANPMFEALPEREEEGALHAGRIVPIHALTQGIGGKGMRRMVHHAL